MNSTHAIKTITGIKSTSRIDGEVVRASKFLAETELTEFYAYTDCIVALRDDLGDADLLLELIELSAEDKSNGTLYVETDNGVRHVYVNVPINNQSYVYYVAPKNVTAEMILKALMTQARNMGVAHEDLDKLAHFENRFLGKACRGNFAMYYHAVATHADYRFLQQFESTVLKTISKLMKVD